MHRRVWTGALIAALALAVPGLQTASAAPSAAGEGMQVLCSEAGYGCLEGTGYTGQSRWGANYFKTGHNCTSYVSFRLAQQGVAQPWRPMGNANRWDDNGKTHVRVDDLPAAGAVAQWEGGTRFAPNPSGHVAFVESVRGDTIEITDDSHSGGTRRVRIQQGSPYWPDHFVHIHDLAAPPMTNGTWVLAGVRSAAAAQAQRATFGQAGDVPVVGDWDGDGKDTVGVFRDGTWALATSNSTEMTPPSTFTFGQAGDVPVVGDWDGDGKDTVGVFRDGTWLLSRVNESDSPSREVRLGGLGDAPVVGDWNADRRDTFGVFRDGVWTLTDSPVASADRLVRFRLGTPGDRPVIGNWDGVRGDTVALFRDGTFTLTSNNASAPRELRTIVLGSAGDLPIAGRWTPKSVDTVGTAS